MIKEVIGPFKESLPTADLRDFVSAVEEYVDKVRFFVQSYRIFLFFEDESNIFLQI